MTGPVPQPPRAAAAASAREPAPGVGHGAAGPAASDAAAVAELVRRRAGHGPLVVLVGPPGSGKSTTGHSLAHALGVAWRDTDADVEATAGKSVADIFIDDGEPHFRSLEQAAVATALVEHDGVLALGGGAVLAPATEAALAGYVAAGGVVVFLDVSLAQVAPRVGFNQARPLLLGNPRAKWAALMAARRPVYERVAQIQVLTDDKTSSQVAQEILRSLPARSPRTTPTSPEDPA